MTASAKPGVSPGLSAAMSAQASKSQAALGVGLSGSNLGGAAARSTVRKPWLIAGLDIGSSKVSIVIGQLTVPSPIENNITLEIVGLGTAPNSGIRQGVVVNVDATIEAIEKARVEAELMAGYQIDEVLVAVGGTHIKSFDSRGMIAIRNKEVRQDDVDRVIEAAKAVAVPADRVVLHVLPREFKIDEQAGIFDPLNMSGVRLEANVHIVTAGQTNLHNIAKCTEKAGLKIKGLVLQQLASSLSILSEDERKLGVCVVDMGAGTCDMITYTNGAVAHTASLPVGGQHFTQDIAMGLRSPQTSAEIVKKKFGCAITDLVDENQTIEVDGVGGRKPRLILRRDLCQLIEPRAEETLAMISQELRSTRLVNQIGSGIVLSGGACQMEGLAEMGEFITEVPVRRGFPEKAGGLTEVVRRPECSTAVGLLIFGMQNLTDAERAKILQQAGTESSIPDMFQDWKQKVKDFFGGMLSN
jgi:cell division protein FtsA